LTIERVPAVVFPSIYSDGVGGDHSGIQLKLGGGEGKTIN